MEQGEKERQELPLQKKGRQKENRLERLREIHFLLRQQERGIWEWTGLAF